MVRLVKYKESLGANFSKVREVVSDIVIRADIQPMTARERMGLFGEINNNYLILFIYDDVPIDNSYTIIIDEVEYDIENIDDYKGFHKEVYVKEVT